MKIASRFVTCLIALPKAFVDARRFGGITNYRVQEFKYRLLKPFELIDTAVRPKRGIQDKHVIQVSRDCSTNNHYFGSRPWHIAELSMFFKF